MHLVKAIRQLRAAFRRLDVATDLDAALVDEVVQVAHVEELPAIGNTHAGYYVELWPLPARPVVGDQLVTCAL